MVSPTCIQFVTLSCFTSVALPGLKYRAAYAIVLDSIFCNPNSSDNKRVTYVPPPEFRGRFLLCNRDMFAARETVVDDGSLVYFSVISGGRVIQFLATIAASVRGALVSEMVVSHGPSYRRSYE